jgi:uncharacterized protein
MIHIKAADPSLERRCPAMDFIHFLHSSPLSALCGSGDPLTLISIAAVLFGTGLFGGFFHCAPMCGPFVLMQLAGAVGTSRGTLPGYHLGRMTTYVALGAAAGALGQSVVELTALRSAFAVPLAVAALAFLAQGLKRLFPSLPRVTFTAAGQRWGAAVARLAAALAPLSLKPRLGLKGYGLGLILGLLPCGFLYAALIAAAASGGGGAGALAMAGFALGTIPALLAVGILGGAVLQRRQRLASLIATPVFLLNAATLGGLAARMVGVS